MLGQIRRQALWDTPKVREGTGCELGIEHLQRPFQIPRVLGLCGDAAGVVQGEHHWARDVLSPWHGQRTKRGPSSRTPSRSRLGLAGGQLCAWTTRSIKMGWSSATVPGQTPRLCPPGLCRPETLNHGWFLVSSEMFLWVRDKFVLVISLPGHGSKWIFISQLMPGLNINCFSVLI